MRRLHFYVGVFVGPFLLVSAVTGVMYTVAPSLAQSLHRHELSVETVKEAKLPLSQQVRAAQLAYPGRDVVSVATGERAESTTKVVVSGAGCPCAVFVDPYTAQVRGSAPGDGVQVFEGKWVDDLHRTLFLGEFGRNYAELSASWLWVLVLSGPFLWRWSKRRSEEKDRRARLRSRHAMLGLALAPGLLFLSASGLSWSLHAGNNIDDLRTALSGANPPLAKTRPVKTPGQQARAVAQDQREWLERIDRVEAGARSVGLVDPLLVTPAAGQEAAWTVSDRERAYPMRYDRAAVDPDTGSVVGLSQFADWPLLAKITQWAIALHMGLLFGWANQLVLAVIGIGLVAMILYGYRMWWLRFRRSGGGLRRSGGELLPAAPARGTLVGLPPATAAALVGAMLFAGWFFPVLGASLVAFVALDVLLGTLARRRAHEAQ